MKVSNSGIFSNNRFPGSRIPGIPSPCPQLGCFFLHIEAFSNTSTRSWHCNIAASKLQFPWQQLSWRYRVSSHLSSISQSLNIKVTQRDSCCRQDGSAPSPFGLLRNRYKVTPLKKLCFLPCLKSCARLHRLARGRLILTDRILWARFSNCAFAN